MEHYGDEMDSIDISMHSELNEPLSPHLSVLSRVGEEEEARKSLIRLLRKTGC